MLNIIVLKNFKSKNKDKYKPGTEVALNRGYARYLIKQGKVLAATDDNKDVAHKILKEENEKRVEKIAQAHKLGEKLQKEKLSFIVNQYNGNGIFFGAIKTQDIVIKLHKLSSSYHSIKNNDVTLNGIIKLHGTYTITIHLYETEIKMPVFAAKSESELHGMYEDYYNIKTQTEDSKEENLKEEKE